WARPVPSIPRWRLPPPSLRRPPRAPGRTNLVHHATPCPPRPLPSFRCPCTRQDGAGRPPDASVTERGRFRGDLATRPAPAARDGAKPVRRLGPLRRWGTASGPPRRRGRTRTVQVRRAASGGRLADAGEQRPQRGAVLRAQGGGRLGECEAV